MRDNLEASLQRSNFLYLCATDPHEARARELRAIARSKFNRVNELLAVGDAEGAEALEHDAARDWKGADRIMNCGTSRRAELLSERYQSRRCGRRDCPGCASRCAAHYIMRIGVGAERMGNQLVTMFTVPVKWRPGQNPTAVRNMIKNLRKALVQLRRRTFFRRVVDGGIGAIEPKIADDRSGFNLHAHVVLDATATAIDVGEIDAAWNKVTGGHFSIEHNRPLLENTWAFAGYVAKIDTWGPEVGTLDLGWLEAIRVAINGQQIVVAWGSAAPPRRRPTA